MVIQWIRIEDEDTDKVTMGFWLKVVKTGVWL